MLGTYIISNIIKANITFSQIFKLSAFLRTITQFSLQPAWSHSACEKYHFILGIRAEMPNSYIYEAKRRIKNPKWWKKEETNPVQV